LYNISDVVGRTCLLHYNVKFDAYMWNSQSNCVMCFLWDQPENF